MIQPLTLFAAFLSLCQMFGSEAFAPPVRERHWNHAADVHVWCLTKAGWPQIIDGSCDYYHEGETLIVRVQWRGYGMGLERSWQAIITPKGWREFFDHPAVDEGVNINTVAFLPWPKLGETVFWAGEIGFYDVHSGNGAAARVSAQITGGSS